MAKNKTIDWEEEIKKTTSQFLEKLRIVASISIIREKAEGDSKEDVYKVNIETEETGLLIGRHGETLNSLQLLLGIIIYQKTKQWARVVLDIGNYRKMREEGIKEMVTRITAEVEASGNPVTLPYLTPLERRIVHMTLSDNPKITSESQGEGKERRVIIRLR
jgi:spoIIIJ-associated protein